MASDLKAVVEITADTKGLVTGIAGATKAIESGTSNIEGLMNFHALKKGLELAHQGFDKLARHYEDLYKVATTYSPAAAAADENLAMTRVRADQMTATATAPGAIISSRLQEQAAMNEARRNVDSSSSISNGMAGMTQITSNFKSLGSMVMDLVGHEFTSGSDVLSNLLSGNLQGAASSYMDATKGYLDFGQQVIDPGNYVYADQAKPGRGMPGSANFDMATQHLAAIREKMGGQ